MFLAKTRFSQASDPEPLLDRCLNQTRRSMARPRRVAQAPALPSAWFGLCRHHNGSVSDPVEKHVLRQEKEAEMAGFTDVRKRVNEFLLNRGYELQETGPKRRQVYVRVLTNGHVSVAFFDGYGTKNMVAQSFPSLTKATRDIQDFIST